tara:strand:+ start:1351 stop:1530 length:180 start_codon:yes stop_codon:yes gene_type:complete
MKTAAVVEEASPTKEEKRVVEEALPTKEEKGAGCRAIVAAVRRRWRRRTAAGCAARPVA